VIRKELAQWETKTSGIAALSFTRVAGDEIRKAVGHELSHPHFVGTIDAFLFRYIIRPHLRRVVEWFAEPRLIAGEWGANSWAKCSSDIDATVGQSINLFGCVFIGEENGEEVIAYQSQWSQLTRVTGSLLTQVRKGKVTIWTRRGLLTHSDAALWAAKVLEDSRFGPAIRAEIIRRFPVLIVDELQDTGHFLGKIIRTLLEEPATRGVLVGDPDQAIYEFTGARPDLFNTFEAIPGAVGLPLANSQRCSADVFGAAIHVKDSEGAIYPAENRVGQAYLVRYDTLNLDVRRIVEAVAIASRPEGNLRVIARGSATVEALTGGRSEIAPPLYCPPLQQIHRAVVALRKGKNVRALAAARAAISRAVFHFEGILDEELIAATIDPSEWKELAVRILLKANDIPVTGTFFDWQTQAGEVIDQEIRAFELVPNIPYVAGNLRPQKRKGWGTPSAKFLPPLNDTAQKLTENPVLTVHGVKGETHATTIFVCPDTTRADRCPSAVWWSSNENDREEKRIAYVAMTRTCGDLIVCVSEACYQRLASNRAEFVRSFQVNTVDEFLSGMGRPTNAPLDTCSTS
jgi:DNA helicase-2/ATP-dependent DNA helicase PcrA